MVTLLSIKTFLGMVLVEMLQINYQIMSTKASSSSYITLHTMLFLCLPVDLLLHDDDEDALEHNTHFVGTKRRAQCFLQGRVCVLSNYRKLFHHTILLKLA